jgi:hypothetical protein
MMIIRLAGFVCTASVKLDVFGQEIRKYVSTVTSMQCDLKSSTSAITACDEILQQLVVTLGVVTCSNRTCNQERPKFEQALQTLSANVGVLNSIKDRVVFLLLGGDFLMFAEK